MRFLIGTALIGIGFSMVWKTNWYLDIFGRNAWAEQKLTSALGAGMGGSWAWYKLLGVIFVVAGILYMTGLLQAIFLGILGPFFGSALDY